jgi:hypothetical protein
MRQFGFLTPHALPIRPHVRGFGAALRAHRSRPRATVGLTTGASPPPRGQPTVRGIVRSAVSSGRTDFFLAAAGRTATLVVISAASRRLAPGVVQQPCPATAATVAIRHAAPLNRGLRVSLHRLNAIHPASGRPPSTSPVMSPDALRGSFKLARSPSLHPRLKGTISEH